MTKTYDALPTITLSDDNTYAHPPELPELVHFNDPAQSVIENFEHMNPPIAHPGDTIDDTMTEMKSSGAHIMIVVEDDHVVGLISSEDIMGEKPLNLIQERRVKRSEILVKGVMTPLSKLIAISTKELRFAKVGHLLSTMRDTKQHYAIVVDTNGDEKQRVQGVVYIYDIIKRLDRNAPSELLEAQSIAELQKGLG